MKFDRSNLPRPLYENGQLVVFVVGGKLCVGKIKFCNYGDTWATDFHSYDIQSIDKKVTYKHQTQRALSPIKETDPIYLELIKRV